MQPGGQCGKRKRPCLFIDWMLPSISCSCQNARWQGSSEMCGFTAGNPGNRSPIFCASPHRMALLQTLCSRCAHAQGTASPAWLRWP